MAAIWHRLAGTVEHTFTHFHLVLEVYLARVIAEAAPEGCTWYAADTLPEEALPSVMRKVLAHALAEPRRRPPSAQPPLL
jgi:A/G-specific adenine glycosylase